MASNGELKNVPTIKAYKNPDWLGAPTSRHIRIMCELYEPMKRLDAHSIDNYFIIVGSHLVMHPEDRVKHIAGLEQQLKKITSEEEVEAVQAKLRFAKKMQNMDKFYSMALELGKKLGEWNKERAASGKPSYHVSTGGGPGIMEAANRGAHEAGETTLGFGASRPEWGSLNRYVSEEGAFEFHYFFMRKFWMAYKCMGLVVMPGGFGSLDELFEMLVLLQTKKITHPMPIILLGAEHWKKAINFDYLLECGMLTQSHLDMLVFKDSAEDAFQYLVESVRKAEESGETEQVRTWAGRAYTDDELSRRFESQSGGDEGLMDEEAAKRLVARERQTFQSDLMDEETVKRKLAAERAQQNEKSKKEEDEEERQRANAARAVFKDDSSDSSSRSRSRSRSKRRTESEAAGSEQRPEAEVQPGQDFLPGFRVTLTNLKQAASLNGSRGVLERFDATSGRWEVSATRHGTHPSLQEERFAIRLGAVIPDGADVVLAANGRQKAEVVRGPESLTGTRDSIAATVARLVLRCAWMWVAQETYSLALCSPEDAFEVRPLAGQKGLTCGVDTNAGAKDGQTLLMRMIFIIVSMHHAGIELDCNFQMCFSAGLDGCLVQERNDDRIAAQDLHELGFLTGIFDGHRGGSCAEFAAKQVPANVLSAYRTRAKREGSLVKLSAEKEAALIADSLVDSFEAWLQAAKKKDAQEGSTGIVTLVSHGFTAPVQAVAKLFVAWAGDCRAVPTSPRSLSELWPMDRTPARSGRTSRYALEETPGKVTRATKRPGWTDSEEQPGGRIVKESEGQHKLPVKELKLAEPQVSGKVTEGSKSADEVLKLTIQEGPEGPTFQMDGKTYRVTDMAAMLEVGTISCSTSTKRMSLAEFKRQRAQSKKSEAAIEKAGGLVVRDAHKVWRVGQGTWNISALASSPLFFNILATGSSPHAEDLEIPPSSTRIRLLGAFDPDRDTVPEDWAYMIGSDGIFDALSDQEVADIIWRAMAGEGKDAVRAAKEVVSAALRKGSRDNITAVICRFGWATPPPMDQAAAAVMSSAGLDTSSAFAPQAEPSDDVNMFG
ncbi:unnamed protein product [Durusdinium trenchii]|uniref:PPM-type phosphatase domain-containing protein n=1 Tax=Durusdinium trenchii TaxID=1381693 RepID=A0ABP0KGM1_9DINO